MIWGKTDAERAARRRHRWKSHLWFAWRPVRLDDGRWVWLEDVMRKRAHGRMDWEHIQWWVYAHLDWD